MIEIIDLENREKWDNIVKYISNYDIYYLSGYAESLKIHGDGEPLLLYYKEENNNIFGYCVLIKRKINDLSSKINNMLDKDYYDYTTPYGYGGFIFSSPNINKKLFHKELNKTMNNLNAVSVFFRFSPIYNNHLFHSPLISTEYRGNTVSIKLHSNSDLIWNNLHTKNRNVIRKAIKSNVEIKETKNFDTFIDIYNKTMINNKANNYYFFKEDYYNTLKNKLTENYKIFNAYYEDKIISSSIIFYTNDYLQYHLSGSLLQYRKFSPSNLLLWTVAKWGGENGFKEFHLGGGLGGEKDTLYSFKKSFNRNNKDLDFYIGKWIVNKDIYHYLEKSLNIDETTFFPSYRKK